MEIASWISMTIALNMYFKYSLHPEGKGIMYLMDWSRITWEVAGGYPQGGSSGYLHVSRDLYNSYENGDLRRAITIQKGYQSQTGSDTITCFYVKYAHGTRNTSVDGF